MVISACMRTICACMSMSRCLYISRLSARARTLSLTLTHSILMPPPALLLAHFLVNDPFVMLEWGKAHNAQDKVLMLADGLGAFRFVREIEHSILPPFSAHHTDLSYMQRCDRGAWRAGSCERIQSSQLQICHCSG